uniref:Zinc phosphodiesterase ELAC protein 1 n=1 Tax=Cacopsylla melanoneura TaxID=428564 RepID=A0A8D9F0J2_9HEMI
MTNFKRPKIAFAWVLSILATFVNGTEVFFIGTGAGGPSKLRGSSSTLMRLRDGEVWMFDCGEGTQIKLNDVYVRPSRVGAIFITHLHGDHVWGLPGVICSHWNSNDTVQRRGKYGFHIFGPRGIRKLVRNQLLLSRSMCMFHYTVHELIPEDSQFDNKNEADYYRVIDQADGPLHPQEILGQDIEAQKGPDGNPVWHLVNDTRGTIVAGKIVHRLPTFGFTYVEALATPNLNKALLTSKYNLSPGIEYGMLQRGYPVHLPNNVTIQPHEAMLKPIPGRKITILGDTCNPYPMLDIAKDSDVLVHEATHFKHQREAAEFYGHSTPTMAIRFAKASNAKLVALTHISQRVTPRSWNTGRNFNKTSFTTDDLMNEAVDELFRYRHKNLSILIAEDGTVLSIEKKHNNSARPHFYLTRLKKNIVVTKTVFESIPLFYQRPPVNYNDKFKANTFLPPLNMLNNFSRPKYLKYYNSSDLDGGVKFVPINSINPQWYTPYSGEGGSQSPITLVNGKWRQWRVEDVVPTASGSIGGSSSHYYDPTNNIPPEHTIKARRTRPFYKQIQSNTGRKFNTSYLNVSENRTFVKLEPEAFLQREYKKQFYFNKTYSEYNKLNQPERG